MTINHIQNKITDIWSYTELEMSDFSNSGLRKHLSAISGIVNDVLDMIDEFEPCHLCSGKICTDCMDDMAEKLAPNEDDNETSS